MWFWLRRPRLTLHESSAFIVLASCPLLSVTIEFVDWPLTSMTERAAELTILLVGRSSTDLRSRVPVQFSLLDGRMN